MNGRDLGIEDVDALEEERPFLRKENREPLVCRDDQLIRFDLREIRIDGKVERDVRRDAVLTRESGIELDWLIHQPARIKHSILQLLTAQSSLSFCRFRECQTGNQFQR